MSDRLHCRLAAVHNAGMRIAIIDESAARASVIQEGLAAVADCELFVVTQRHGLVARTAFSP